MKQNRNFLILGVTGGAGSGKTTVVEQIKQTVPTVFLHCDVIAHKLMEPGGASYDALVKEFGEEILEAEFAADTEKQISPERVTPHFGVIRPGTRFHTITAAYHDELFFSYPAECYEKLVKLLQGNTSFCFSAYPEEPMADLKRELENLNEPGAADRVDVAAIRLFTEIITKYREKG